MVTAEAWVFHNTVDGAAKDLLFICDGQDKYTITSSIPTILCPDCPELIRQLSEYLIEHLIHPPVSIRDSSRS